MIMRLLLSFILAAHLLMPGAAWAQQTMKNPLSYSLREYGMILAIAILGGIASWSARVRRGEIPMWNLSIFIGEMAVSAFAGLITFWLAEYFNLNPLLSAALVGMSGHAGAKGLTWIEAMGQRVVEKRLGIVPPDKQP